MNRGSTWLSEAIRPMPYGFNEAPIHESGKSDGSGLPGIVCLQLQ